MQQRAEARAADLALPNVLVAIHMGVEIGLGVIRVDEHQAGEADGLIEFFECRGHRGRRAQVVAGGKGVAGVEAHADVAAPFLFRFLHLFDVIGDFLK